MNDHDQATRRLLRGMIARAVVSQIDDATMKQTAQFTVLPDETIEGERFQQYGFTSVPFAGAGAIVVFIGGARAHPAVIIVDDGRYRKTGLQPGESALYSDEGDYILLKRGNIIEISAATKLDVTTPLVALSEDLTVGGDTDTEGVYKVAGMQVVGAQQGAITNPLGTLVSLQTQLTSTLNALRAHGLIA